MPPNLHDWKKFIARYDDETLPLHFLWKTPLLCSIIPSSLFTSLCTTPQISVGPIAPSSPPQEALWILLTGSDRRKKASTSHKKLIREVYSYFESIKVPRNPRSRTTMFTSPSSIIEQGFFACTVQFCKQAHRMKVGMTMPKSVFSTPFSFSFIDRQRFISNHLARARSGPILFTLFA